MKKVMWKMGILCLLCLMLGGCSTEKEEEYGEEEQKLLYHRAYIALDFGMDGTPFIMTRLTRNMLDEKESYENVNVYLYADKELADAAFERGEIGERDVYAYATETTLKRLKVLNEYIESEGSTDKLDTYDLEYPITLDDLINKTESFWQCVNDRSLLSQTAYNVTVKWR